MNFLRERSFSYYWSLNKELNMNFRRPSTLCSLPETLFWKYQLGYGHSSWDCGKTGLESYQRVIFLFREMALEKELSLSWSFEGKSQKLSASSLQHCCSTWWESFLYNHCDSKDLKDLVWWWLVFQQDDVIKLRLFCISFIVLSFSLTFWPSFNPLKPFFTTPWHPILLGCQLSFL